MIWTSCNMKYYIEKGYTYTKTREKFMVKIKDLSPSSHTKYPVTCDICGEVFYSSNNSLNRSLNTNLHTCKNCKTTKSVKTRTTLNLDSLWDKLEKSCNDKGYKLITSKKEYSSCKDQIYYECPKHGEQHGSYTNLTHGHGCIECKREYTAKITRNTSEKIFKVIGSINNNILLNPDEYVNSGTKNLKVLCGCCGKNIFTVSFGSYKHGTNRCEFCTASMSKGEFRIYNYLRDNNIEFEQEKTFVGCRDKGLLFFDFYLPKYNMCIEFDGEQHFNNNYDITMKMDDPNYSFNNRIKHDQMKDDYCKKNNIKMLRITYKQEKYIDEILNKELGIFK